VVAAAIRVWVDGQEWPVPDGVEVLFGRSPEAQLRTANPFVSRRHALLRRDRTGWWLQDLDSKRGSFVAGRRIGQIHVSSPTEVVFGDPVQGSVMRLLPVPDAAPVPAAGHRPPPTAPTLQRVPTDATPPAGRSPPHGALSDSLRTVIAIAIVLVAALITDRLLTALDASDLPGIVGFSWLAAVPKVDEVLTRVRLPSRSGGQARPLAPSAGAPPRYTAILYTALVCAGVFAGAFYGGVFLTVLILGMLFSAASLDEIMPVLGLVVLIIGASTLFFVGRALGMRLIERPVLVLLASTVMGVTLLTVFDAMLMDDQYYRDMGTTRLSEFIWSVVLWSVAAVTVGWFGVRRGSRRKTRIRSSVP
jgi:hypothetical protein